MSPPIWTPAALRSDARPWAGRGWRLVEAQHRVSTMKLVDNLAEQAVLEAILDDTKPSLPPDCAGLDYLLATPFRYRPYPHGSRFRRAGFTPGVWYGAQSVTTAVAEMVFYRYLFFAESPATPFPDDAADYTAFAAELAVPLAVDLTTGALAADPRWRHPTDYTACQDLADAARGMGAGLIRYASIRDPDRGTNLAVLTCAAFAMPQPVDRQSWRIRISGSGAMALRDFPHAGIDFPRAAFAADPRLAAMVWDRPRPRIRPLPGGKTP